MRKLGARERGESHRLRAAQGGLPLDEGSFGVDPEEGADDGARDERDDRDRGSGSGDAVSAEELGEAIDQAARARADGAACEMSLQVRRQFRGALIPLFPVDRQRLGDDPVDLTREAREAFAQGAMRDGLELVGVVLDRALADGRVEHGSYNSNVERYKFAQSHKTKTV